MFLSNGRAVNQHCEEAGTCLTCDVSVSVLWLIGTFSFICLGLYGTMSVVRPELQEKVAFSKCTLRVDEQQGTSLGVRGVVFFFESIPELNVVLAQLKMCPCVTTL